MEHNNQNLYPWVSMWLKPRVTIQQIVDTNPQHFVLALAAIEGFSESLNRASMNNMGDRFDWPVIFILAAIIGPIAGIIGLYISGALIRWTGHWIGGNAPIRKIRAAVAWSSIPIIWALILWIPELFLFGQDQFTTETPIINESPRLAVTFLGFFTIEVLVGVWAFIVFLKCLGQVQSFSAWKALGNVVLAGLVVFVPLTVISLSIIGISR